MSAEPREVRPYGSWPSPFPFDVLTAGVVSLSPPGASGGVAWWLEGRPEEGGRQVLVRCEPDGSLTRLTPEGFNARSRVHEYGGAATLVTGDLVVVSDFSTGRLHRVTAPGQLAPLTPEGRAWRFADMELDRERNRLIAVREDHEPATLERHGEAENALVAIDLETGEVGVLVEGLDFYAAPRLSPDGSRLAWLEWSHPNMPWDGMTLRIAPVAADGSLGAAEAIAGSRDDWISQPRWSPSGVLHFAAEPDGWMNLHAWQDDAVVPLTELRAEFSGPDWIFGQHSYDVLSDGTIVAVARSDGRDRLFRVGVEDGLVVEVPVDFTEMGGLAADGDRVVILAASPTRPAAIVELDPFSGGSRVLRRSTPTVPERADVSVPEPIEYPSTGGRIAHGNFYPPKNRAYSGPDGERPPLVVMSHGGPTSDTSSGLSLGIQVFTSRGLAVLDVDYGGSTGYGRDYRRALEGEWGVVDVDDCVAGAQWLAEQGRVDPERLAIRGGSAGGYTTLAALAFRDAFAAGTSLFGLGNLELFVNDTHKFESRYLERLVGPWPETKDRYRERSPSLHADRIRCPVLVLQGLEDRVVPPSEAERIVDALFERRIPHAYVPFEGEDHGFRQAASIRRAAEAELSFYGQVFGFELADDIEPVEVQFLDEVRQGT